MFLVIHLMKETKIILFHKQLYVKLKHVIQHDLNVNILEYSIDRRFKKPLLSQLALTVHDVPATQVSVERTFSALKFILNDLRTSVNENTLEKILLWIPMEVYVNNG